jgi:hypothetical protein
MVFIHAFYAYHMKYLLLLIALLSATQVDAATISGDFSANLTSHWQLEETSGTRVDDPSTNDLTDNNTVLYGTGKQGNGADFERDNTEYLSITDGAQTGLNLNNSFTISFWFKPETVGVDQMLVSKSDGSVSANGGWYVLLDASNQIEFLYINSAGTNYALYYTGAQITSAGSWYHIAITANVSAPSIAFYINGSSVGYTTYRAQTSITATNSSTFQVGGWTYGSLYSDGIIDELSIWSSVLTSGNIATIYNSGSGIAYSSGGGGPVVTYPTVWTFFE